MRKFTLLEPFATGGIAELHLIQLEDGRKAVLRRLLPKNIYRLNEHLSFRYGLKVRAAVTPHKNLVGSIEWGYDFLRPYEIIELVKGDNMKLQFNSRTKLLTEQPLLVLSAAAAGLAWIHSMGYMHLDVKPENFLCQERGGLKIKLTDFDLARPADDNKPRRQMGTPAYMAPEQFVKRISTQASDVFAFSVMAYQILTGRMPFTGDTPKETWRNQASENVIAKSPDEINPEIPKAWCLAITKGLAKRQEQRIPDMNAWLNAVKS